MTVIEKIAELGANEINDAIYDESKTPLEKRAYVMGITAIMHDAMRIVEDAYEQDKAYEDDDDFEEFDDEDDDDDDEVKDVWHYTDKPDTPHVRHLPSGEGVGATYEVRESEDILIRQNDGQVFIGKYVDDPKQGCRFMVDRINRNAVYVGLTAIDDSTVNSWTEMPY